MTVRDTAPRALRFVSFVAFLSTVLIYSPNVAVLHPVDLGQSIGLFAEPYLVCVAAVAAALAVASWRMGPAFTRRATRTPVLLCCAAVYLAATAAYVVALHFAPGLAVNLALPCAVTGGIATVPCFLMWAQLFADLTLQRSIVGVACSFALVGLCGLALSLLEGAVLVGAYLVLLALGCLWPFHALLGRQQPGAAPAPSREAEQAPVPAPNFGAFLSVMGFSLLGLAISSFVMGIQPVYVFEETLDAQRLGIVLGAIALLPVSMHGVKPAYTFVYQVYLPAIAAAMTLLCVIPFDGRWYDVVLVLLSAFYYTVIGIAIAFACAIANAREFSRTFVFSTLIAAFCAMAILGIFLGGRIGVLFDNNAVALEILTTLYACTLFLVACAKSWRMVTRPAEQDIPPTSDHTGKAPATDQEQAESFEDRLARISAEAGLSPRETQIVEYVGRGHSSVYVARTLFISESTVYSHVRNIYRKLGISSREELIRLFNDPR